MKCTIPEISWHNREPVLSVDISPEKQEFYRLASGGGDCHVLIWQLNITKSGAVDQEVVSDLTRHQRAVNCVRWSNTGQYLASGDDDTNIIIWQQKTDNIPLLEGDTSDKEIWIVYKVLRGHKEDIYDICWSIDGAKLLSGSIDNTAVLWDVQKGCMDHILRDHKGFVQGVAWDPKNQMIATLSTDRICRLFDCSGKQVRARIYKGKINSVPDNHYLKDKEVKFFHDDTFKSFFRRLQFSPDGSLLIVPSGHIEIDDCKNVINSSLIFTLDNLSSPAAILPLGRQNSTVVRCCPILFELHEDGPDPIIKLPYRIVFAIGTDHDIILYDTQQNLPFARFQDLHYTRLTDLTWSQDGLLLIASSTDGFCTLITFDLDELGVPWVKDDSEAEDNPLNISGCQQLIENDEDIQNMQITLEQKDTNIKENVIEETKKRSSFLEQWALKTPKKKRGNEENKRIGLEKSDSEVLVILDSPVKENDIYSSEKVVKEIQEKPKIKRIAPIKVEQNIKNIEKVASIKPRTTLLEDVVEKHKLKKNMDEESCSSSKKIINVLIPRRKKTTPIEVKTGTCVTMKDISVIDGDTSQSSRNLSYGDKESSQSNEIEELTKEEWEDYQKSSKEIRGLFCRVPKQKDTTSNFKEAKPIAVRRKPMLQTISDSNLDAKCKVQERNMQSQNLDGTQVTLRKELKEINEDCKETKTLKVTKENEDVICVSDEGLDNRPPKIKVSSLVNIKNKTGITPKKASTLLNFFQRPAEEKLNKKKEDGQIIMTLDDNEAQDAWKWKSKEPDIEADKKNNQITETGSICDDKTEDFHLLLEDSQETCCDAQEKAHHLKDSDNEHSSGEAKTGIGIE